MVRKGIYRGEIWYCQLDEISLENHLCLVISSWRNLLKSPKLQVLTITSQEKDYDKTVFMLDKDKYGLDKTSYIHAECIYTISKSKLIKRICKLDNLTMIEVDELIKDQLNLNSKYLYLTDEDILNKFKEENNSIKQDDLIKLKCECYRLYKEKKYNESINRCNELLKATKQAKSGRNEYSRYAHYIISMNFMKLNNNYEKALEHINQALVLIEKKNGYDCSFSIMLWNKAKCLEKLKKNDEAIKLYESLSNYYYRYRYNVLSLVCRFNSCKVINDIESMIYIKEELEDLKVITLGIHETEEYKLTMIEEMNKEINSIKELI